MVTAGGMGVRVDASPRRARCERGSSVSSGLRRGHHPFGGRARLHGRRLALGARLICGVGVGFVPSLASAQAPAPAPAEPAPAPPAPPPPAPPPAAPSAPPSAGPAPAP